MSRRSVWRCLLPAAFAAASLGCFATRQDVQTLQSDMESMRAQTAHADSARQAQIAAVASALAQANDTLRGLSARLTKWQGDVRGDLYTVQQELIQIQELTGQSQRRLQELRAGLEVRGQSLQPSGMGAPSPSDSSRGAPMAGTPPGGPPTSGTAAPGSPSTSQPGAPAPTVPGSPPGGPGPNQLFQLALDQLRRGSTGAARAGFSDLLRQYPNADVAADAQFYLAETYANEGNTAAADSGYQAVVAKYPSSPRAPTALYKHGVAMQAAGNIQAARAALSDVIRKYPRSDEAVLAKDRLRTLQ